jgi:O-antigen ligase
MAMRDRTRVRAGGTRETLLSPPVTALIAGLLAAVVAVVLYKLGNPQHQLKAGLGVVALLVVILAAFRPVLALGIVFGLLPFEYHVYGVGTDEALIFVVGVVLAARIQLRRTPLWVFLAGSALVVGSALSAVHAQDAGSALWGAVRWIGVLLLLVDAYSLLHDQPDAGRKMVDIIACSAVVVVFFGLLQDAGIYYLVGAPYQAGNIQSFFSYYTNYAGFVAVVAVLASGEVLAALDERDTARAVAYAAVVVFMLLGVGISASRGGLLSLGAGWAALLVLSVRRGGLLVRVVALLAVLAVAGFAATPSGTRTRFITRFSAPLGSQTEDQQRFALQKLGEQALAKNPLGIGYNNFRFYLANHPISQANQIFYHSHRLVVQIGLDTGWLGLAGFLALYLGAMVAAIRAGPWRGLRNIACAAALTGFMAQGLFDYVFFDISLVAIFAALVWGATRPPAPRRTMPDVAPSA